MLSRTRRRGAVARQVDRAADRALELDRQRAVATAATVERRPSRARACSGRCGGARGRRRRRSRGCSSSSPSRVELAGLAPAAPGSPCTVIAPPTCGRRPRGSRRPKRRCRRARRRIGSLVGRPVGRDDQQPAPGADVDLEVVGVAAAVGHRDHADRALGDAVPRVDAQRRARPGVLGASTAGLPARASSGSGRSARAVDDRGAAVVRAAAEIAREPVRVGDLDRVGLHAGRKRDPPELRVDADLQALASRRAAASRSSGGSSGSLRSQIAICSGGTSVRSLAAASRTTRKTGWLSSK